MSRNSIIKVAGLGSARALRNLETSSEKDKLDCSDDSHDGNDVTVPLLRYECRAMSRRVGTLLYNETEVRHVSSLPVNMHLYSNQTLCNTAFQVKT